MTRLQRALIFAFALIPSLLLVGERAWAGEYRIAVLAYRGKAEALRQWRGHAEYLNARLAPDRFEVVPLGYDQIDKAVAQGSVSFVITNSGHYTELELRGAVAALATRLLAGQGEALDRFGGVLITRPERTDINGYADLAGSSVLYPDRSSLGGWQVHLREAIEAGVDAQDFEGIETGDHEAVVRGVLAGQADAGFVRSDLLESMAAAGKLSLSAVRVVAPRGTPGYPICTAPGSTPNGRLPASPACPTRSPGGLRWRCCRCPRASRPRRARDCSAGLRPATTSQSTNSSAPPTSARIRASVSAGGRSSPNTICRYPSSLPRSSPCWPPPCS